MFSYIERLQELIKSYYIALTYDAQKAASLLDDINALRLEIALDAEMRQIFYAQVDVPSNATGFQQNVWYSQDDIQYNLRRGIALLDDTAQVSAVNQGNRQRVITREPLAWQQIFSAVQDNAVGQQTLFDFPQEIRFDKNEALGLSLQNQTAQGWVFYHGCTLKDTLEDVRRDEIANEIANYLPQPELIPLVFYFPNDSVGTYAINASGGDSIFSSKYDRSVIITEVSTTAIDARYSLIDVGRNQLICQRVEAAGISGQFQNPYSTFYKLPYPHLLRAGDRLRLEALNGSILTDATTNANELQFLTFKGYSV